MLNKIYKLTIKIKHKKYSTDVQQSSDYKHYNILISIFNE